MRWGEARKPVSTSGRSSKFDYVYAHDSLVELSAEVARSRIRQDAPGFERFALTRRAEGVVIDLVHEKTLQLATEKPTIDGVVVDPREEILANKLTVLVGRMEVPAVSQ